MEYAALELCYQQGDVSKLQLMRKSLTDHFHQHVIYLLTTTDQAEDWQANLSNVYPNPFKDLPFPREVLSYKSERSWDNIGYNRIFYRLFCLLLMIVSVKKILLVYNFDLMVCNKAIIALLQTIKGLFCCIIHVGYRRQFYNLPKLCVLKLVVLAFY